MVTLTPKQVDAIHIRQTLTCTDIQVARWAPTSRKIEVSYLERTRLIETVRIDPSGKVKVLS